MPLSKPQAKVAGCKSRFRVLVTGRRFGKTKLALRELCRYARVPNSNVTYVAPTHRVAKKLMLKPMVKKLRELRWLDSLNKSDMILTLVNGSTINICGGSSEDNLRGDKNNFIVLDETARIDQNIFYEVLRPTLSDTEGDALFIGTPRGRSNWLHDLFVKEKKNSRWKSFSYTSEQGGFVTPGEIEDAKEDLSRLAFQQEYMADFTSSQNSVYYDYDRELNNTVSQITERMTLHIGIDFNVNIMATVVGVVEGQDLYILDEFHGDRDTQQLIVSIKRRYKNVNIRLYPDASGDQRSSATTASNIKQLQNAFGNRNVVFPRANPRIESRVNIVNAKICNAKNERHLFINTSKCPKLVTALERQPYNEKTGQPLKTIKNPDDDLNDALGYLTVGVFGRSKATIKRFK